MTPRHFFTLLALLAGVVIAPLHAAAAQEGQAAVSLQVSVEDGHGGESICPGSANLRADDGAPVTWCYRVTNIGSIAVSDALVTDTNVDITFISFEELQPGESETFFHNTSAVQGLSSNATVTVESANGTASASGSATISAPPATTTTTSTTTTSTTTSTTTTAAPAPPPPPSASTTTVPRTALRATTTAPQTTASQTTAPQTTLLSTTTALQTTVPETTAARATTVPVTSNPPEALAFADESTGAPVLGYVAGAALLVVGLSLILVGVRRT